jgi:hypothetical protein
MTAWTQFLFPSILEANYKTRVASVLLKLSVIECNHHLGPDIHELGEEAWSFGAA